ncbi:hypothetical protein MFLAVUS_010417 [Mucor flavus]|uniref:Uncharacterized protein n=1 Tax=Mucor flavus TaxID=439312 RepID=A0ABP9ZCN8_9FUNG
MHTSKISLIVSILCVVVLWITVLPNSLLIDTFGRALPGNLFEQVTVAVAPLDDTRKYDLDIITAFARDFYNKFYKKNVSSSASPSSPSTSSKRSHVQAAFDSDDGYVTPKIISIFATYVAQK